MYVLNLIWQKFHIILGRLIPSVLLILPIDVGIPFNPDYKFKCKVVIMGNRVKALVEVMEVSLILDAGHHLDLF